MQLMNERTLTPLQLDVLRRLYETGHTALAGEARDLWVLGRLFENLHLGGDPQLRADFDRANAEATHRPAPGY